MFVLGLIPARGGSKGIPGKNTRLLCGKPLLQYTAEAALNATCLSKVILSTDDQQIARLGQRFGLTVPFLRPSELARDDTPTLPVVRHAVEFLEERGDRVDAVCLLQPTCPFRGADLIDACIKLLVSSNADSVMTVLRVPSKYNPHWVYFQSDDGVLLLSTGEATLIPRRQDLPAAFHREGSVYVTRRNVVMQENTLYGRTTLGYPVDAERSVNIDSIDDWNRAERLLEQARGASDVEALVLANDALQTSP